MKKIVICSVLATSLLFTSCIGSFTAFSKLRDWNEGVTDNKFGNELIFIALWVIPVYQLALTGDLLIFNSIEFWGGDNPIAMNEGDSDTKTIVSKGNTYKITATKNRFHIEVVDGERIGETSNLVYVPNDKSWNIEKDNGELIKLSSLKKGLLMAHLPDGNTIEIPNNLNRQEAITFLDSEILNFQDCQYAELN